LDTTFKIKRSKVKAAFLTAVLARQVAAAVGMGTCWPWETAALLPSALRRKARFGAHWGRRGAGHIAAAARLHLVYLFYYTRNQLNI